MIMWLELARGKLLGQHEAGVLSDAKSSLILYRVAFSEQLVITVSQSLRISSITQFYKSDVVLCLLLLEAMLSCRYLTFEHCHVLYCLPTLSIRNAEYTDISRSPNITESTMSS